MHWTQTPAGREKQRRRMKRMWREKRRAQKQQRRSPSPKQGAKRGTTHQHDQAPVLPGADLHVAYAFGRAQQLIYAYAEAVGLPGQQLADRVGQLLQDPDGRRVRGARDPLP